MKQIALHFLLTCCAFHTYAQSADSLQAITANFFTNSSPNYLLPLKALQSIESESRQNPQKRNHFNELMATFQSFAGEYRSALCYYDALSGPRQKAADTSLAAAFSGYEPVSARQAIVSMAASNQVTIINEAHHVPYHRLFVKSLLKDLYDAGYRYFSVETLSPYLNTGDRKYPIAGDGFYQVEPLFADMLRTAMQLGYTLVSHENAAPCKGNCREEREANQGANLYKILQKDPSAKVLVHVGYSHLLEKERAGLKRMAGHFKSLSGIDPLTINQQIMSERSSPAYQNEYYNAAHQFFSITEPSVLMKEDSVWIEPENKSFFDVQVFHPRFRDKYGRPGYYALDATREPRQVKLDKKHRNIIVQAFFASEKNAGRLPVDQVVLANGNSVYLMLPAGEFEVVVKDVDGKVLEEKGLVILP